MRSSQHRPGIAGQCAARCSGNAMNPLPPRQRCMTDATAIEVLARQLTDTARVLLPGGRGELTGKPGDWLVEYGADDCAIVGREIFAATYELIAD